MALQGCTVIVEWVLGIPYPRDLPEGDSTVQFTMLATEKKYFQSSAEGHFS